MYVRKTSYHFPFYCLFCLVLSPWGRKNPNHIKALENMFQLCISLVEIMYEVLCLPDGTSKATLHIIS